MLLTSLALGFIPAVLGSIGTGQTMFIVDPNNIRPELNASCFSLLTYNVAGLPNAINTNDIANKYYNALRIGQKLADTSYDIVHLQEDFHYHPIIWKYDNHKYHTLSSGAAMSGDGLNTLSNYNLTDFYRHTWEECALNGGDCLTPKGFTHLTAQIRNLTVDLYNLHADAGDKDEDRKARSKGLDQILAHVKRHAGDRPVILAGDFNDMWTNSNNTINKLTGAGFSDAWVKLRQNNTLPKHSKESNVCGDEPEDASCEVVDKVFYRSGKDVELQPIWFKYESKIFRAGVEGSYEGLSDHLPVHVDFYWSHKNETKEGVKKSMKKEFDASVSYSEPFLGIQNRQDQA